MTRKTPSSERRMNNLLAFIFAILAVAVMLSLVAGVLALFFGQIGQ
jgi:hypothetical protein